MRSCLGTLLASTVLSGPSLAQEFLPVLASSDRVAGEPVTRIQSPLIRADRHWAALVSTYVSPTTTLRLVVDGSAILSVGDTLAAPPARVASFVNLAGSTENLAVLAVLEQMQPPLPPRGAALLRNGRVVLLAGAPLDVAGLPAGTLCRNIHSIGANSRGTVMALVETAALELALVRLEFDELGVNVVRTVELRAGQALPDGSLVSTFDFVAQGGFSQTVNEDGNWLWRVTATDGRERLVTRERVLLRAGDPSPVAGRSILSVHPTNPLYHCHDSNELGGYAAVVVLSGNPSSDQLLIKNSAKLAQEGDVLAALAPQALVDIDESSVRISSSGHVYWVALTDGAVGNNVAVMRDLEVFVRLGEAYGSQQVAAIDGHNFEITPDGRYLLGRMNLDNDRALMRLDFGASVPILGCSPNRGTLRHTGGTVLAGHTLRLTLDGPAPLGSFVRLQTSLGEATPGNPCGLPTPFGEFLLDPNRRLATLFAGTFASSPVHLDVSVPSDPALVDLEIFAQGAFMTPRNAVLTNGMRFVIGRD